MKRLTGLLIFAGCLLWSQVSLPKTPAGRRFGEWLEVFNRGQRADLLEFLKTSFPDRAAEVDRSMSMRQQSGGFDLEKVEESAETKITGLVKGRASGRTVNFTLSVEPGAPHRIIGMEMRPVGRPAAVITAGSRVSEKEALAAFSEELDRRAAKDEFSGAALVARNGKAIFEQAYGLANREKKIPNKVDTIFRIGSMSKMFTAVAIAQLAQAGKLEFTDRVGKFLPDYPNRDVASKVTIHHLLTHTGGTGDIFGPQFVAHRQELSETKDYVTLYGKRGLEFEPGARYSYSNYGFMLLGVIIEKVTGQSYYEYVRERIFKVAGMSSTDSFPESMSVPGRAVGYIRERDTFQPNTDNLPPRGASAGGGYSTVGDLLRFAEAMQSNKLLNAHYTELVTTGKVDAGPGKYGYGFTDTMQNGVRWFGHGGGSPGVNGELKVSTGSGYTIAVLSNLDPPAATRMAGYVAERLPAK